MFGTIRKDREMRSLGDQPCCQRRVPPALRSELAERSDQVAPDGGGQSEAPARVRTQALQEGRKRDLGNDMSSGSYAGKPKPKPDAMRNCYEIGDHGLLTVWLESLPFEVRSGTPTIRARGTGVVPIGLEKTRGDSEP